MPQPVQTTLSPGFHCGWEDSSTVPAKSMPAIIGKRRTTGALPVSARPSLQFSVDHSMRTVTSPSISSASSNCVSAAVVPLSALSIRIALNVATAKLPDLFQGMFSRSGRLRNRSLDRFLHDRKIDQRREHAEQDREPPDRRVGTEPLEHDAAEPDAEEAADLMADEGKAIEGCKPARAEHQ